MVLRDDHIIDQYAGPSVPDLHWTAEVGYDVNGVIEIAIHSSVGSKVSYLSLPRQSLECTDIPHGYRIDLPQEINLAANLHLAVGCDGVSPRGVVSPRSTR